MAFGGVTLALLLASAPAHTLTIERIMSPAEVSADLKGAKDTRAILLKASPSSLDISGDHIVMTLSGGFPNPVQVMIALVPFGSNAWQAEQIWTFPEPEKQTEVNFQRSEIDRKTSLKILELLKKPRLFKEADGISGFCTDQATIVIEINYHGHSREAVRTSCPANDITKQLIDVILSAPPAAPH